MRHQSRLGSSVLLAVVALSSAFLVAQSPVQSCNTTPKPAWCNAVEGDRSQGWQPQHRSEVTVMGGDMQAQGIAQVLLNVLDLGANLQAATDMARFRHNQVPNVLSLESQLYALVGGRLQAMGHKTESINGGAVGGYQAIMFTPDSNAPSAAGGALQPIGGFYRAGSDHRKDGQAAGY